MHRYCLLHRQNTNEIRYGWCGDDNNNNDDDNDDNYMEEDNSDTVCEMNGRLVCAMEEMVKKKTI